MTHGVLGLIICPMLDDNLVYSLSKDSEDRDLIIMRFMNDESITDISKLTGLSSTASLGGTGLLIVVGVALETFKQLESSAVSRSYQTTGKRRRG